MKNLAFFLSSFALMANCMFAEGMRGFEHFSAPEVTGAFHSPRSPLGATTPLGATSNGHTFSIGFYLSNEDESSPIVMWMPKSGNQRPMEVKSLASINIVVSQLAAVQPSDYTMGMAIGVARRLVANTVVNKGSGGFSLNPKGMPRPRWIFSRLREAGLSDNDVELLKGLVEQSEFTVRDKEWKHSWFEVDSLGSVEKITLKGTVGPPRVKSLQRETVFEAGKIDVEILKKERWIQMKNEPTDQP